jgi:hypothetical protein
VTAPSGLAQAASDPPAHALLAVFGASSWLDLVQFHLSLAAHHVGDLFDHPAHSGTIGQFDCVIDAAQAKPANAKAMLWARANQAADQGYLNDFSLGLLL